MTREPGARAKRLRDVFMQTLSSANNEFPYWYTRRDFEHDNEIPVVRRAMALKAAFSHLTPVIFPGELLVMRKAPFFRGSFPMPWLSEGFYMAKEDELYQDALARGPHVDEHSQFGRAAATSSSFGKVVSIAGKFGMRQEEIPGLLEIARMVGKSVDDLGHKYEPMVPGYEIKEAIMRNIVCMFDSGYTLPQGREVINYYYPLHLGFDGMCDRPRAEDGQVAGRADGDGLTGMNRLYNYEAVVLATEGLQAWVRNYAAEARRLEAFERALVAEVRRELEALMLDHGADGVSFETIVAAGPNSAIRTRPTDAVLAAGDFVKIDFGALVCGYHSDMTRTFVLAPVAQWQLDIYELVAAAQRAGREALAPGVALQRRRRRVAAGHRRRRVRRELRPRPRPRGRPADPRSAGNQRVSRRYTACWLCGDRGARCLPARPRRRPHRGHAGRVRPRSRGPELTHPVPQGTGDPLKRGVQPTVASTADFKNGLVLQIDGQLWQIIEFQHVKPGKGPAFVRTKLKNVLSGKVVDKTYNAGVKVETATVDRRDTTYLYRDGSDFVFMDSQDYEQHPLPESLVGDAAELPAGEHAGADRLPRRRSAVPRAAGDRRARGHPHRARPAGRPVQRGHQAGDRWRPAPRSRCRCSSTPATSSRSIPATAATWAG